MKKIHSNFSSPWKWIPTLYIAEGLPYFAVNTLTVLMYTNLGISKADMAFFTGWLYLPWVIKPFWSPFIDIFRTKRWWTITMQLCLALSMAAIAFLLPGNFMFVSTICVFWLMAFFSATHDVAADGFYLLALDERRQAAFVGVRSTFYRIASVVGQGGLVMLAGQLELSTGNIPLAWSLTFGLLSVFFFLIFFYHFFVMPSPESDYPLPGVNAKDILADFLNTFVTFFRKPHILAALAFMLLYRLPEALCIKMVQPFLKDPYSAGGLEMSTSAIGFVNGTIGVIALLGGGIIGGLLIARGGLKRWLWPMAMALALPCAVYCYLALVRPESLTLITFLIGIEQFGYGFGFTAFMMYLMYFSRGESATSHYAFCTAFMALGMMLPGMCAGWIFEWMDNVALPPACIEWLHSLSSHGVCERPGYILYFFFVMISTLATFTATYAIRRLQIEQ